MDTIWELSGKKKKKNPDNENAAREDAGGRPCCRRSNIGRYKTGCAVTTDSSWLPDWRPQSA